MYCNSCVHNDDWFCEKRLKAIPEEVETFSSDCSDFEVFSLTSDQRLRLLSEIKNCLESMGKQ
jgi:hypothetical protein